MIGVSKNYLEVLKRRDFFVLSLMIFSGQLATAFLILSLIVTVFSQTGSSFGVSGVILSLTTPAFLLMAFAGLAADIFDRRKIMIVSYGVISLVVLFILLSGQSVSASIPLSFLYFAGNTFFIPASSAASAQLVTKEQLLAANSIFVFILSGALLSGFFLASVIHFFFSNIVTFFISEVLLLFAISLGFFLPRLDPVRRNHPSVVKHIKEIIKGFVFIIKAKIVWYFFVMFALIQVIIIFGVTLAPSFFTEVVGIPIDKSPILIFPLIGIGVAIGVGLISKKNISEGFLVVLGLGLIGLASVALGVLLKFDLIYGSLLFYIVFYLISIGFGAIITLIASRTVIQKEVHHSNLGVVFGASMILTSFASAVVSPLAALFETIFGFANILIWGGLVFLLTSAIYAHFGNRWKY